MLSAWNEIFIQVVPVRTTTTVDSIPEAFTTVWPTLFWGWSCPRLYSGDRCNPLRSPTTGWKKAIWHQTVEAAGVCFLFWSRHKNDTLLVEQIDQTLKVSKNNITVGKTPSKTWHCALINIARFAFCLPRKRLDQLTVTRKKGDLFKSLEWKSLSKGLMYCAEVCN